jgi:pteridine reductase
VLAPAKRSATAGANRAGKVPLARHGTVEDVAGAVVYLAAAPYVTGQVLFVDGGQHLLRALDG